MPAAKGVGSTTLKVAKMEVERDLRMPSQEIREELKETIGVHSHRAATPASAGNRCKSSSLE